MSEKVDRYMAELAELNERDAEPNGMSLDDELERINQLDRIWYSMTTEEHTECTERLKEKRADVRS
jgi:hypothetical protein